MFLSEKRHEIFIWEAFKEIGNLAAVLSFETSRSRLFVSVRYFPHMEAL